MTDDKRSVPSKSGSADVAAFLDKLSRAPVVRTAEGRGRLMFAMDATASREPTWDRACHIQGEMFSETDALGGLEVQLVYFRGYRECKSSSWVSTAADLIRRMTAVHCMGGQTQIGRVLKHAIAQAKEKRVNALVYVGDAMEEDVDALCHQAGELGMLGVPVFVFHEGGDPGAARAFRQFAKLTGGAYCPFDSSSASQLRELLSAVAVYAAGGRRALLDYGKRSGAAAVAQITSQVK
jgi:hypothetical protein